MKRAKGFTLIELMIVVAIIAILAALALPAYQDFIKRSKVSEAIVASGVCKTSVAEYAASTNSVPTSIADAGCDDIGSQFVGTPTVADGVITIPVANIAADVVGNIVLTPDITDIANGRIIGWTCSSNIADRFLPANCR